MGSLIRCSLVIGSALVSAAALDAGPQVGKSKLPEVELSAANTTAPGVLHPEEQDRVNKAIERGIAYLRLNQLDSGPCDDGTDITKRHTVAAAALPGLALLECGVPPADPAIQKAARFVRQKPATHAGT